MKLQLVITVNYRSNGETEQALADLLSHIAEHAANNGMLTGETEAEVDAWNYTVNQIANLKSKI